MKKENKVIYLNVRGGLGNQLFCYYAGEYLRDYLKISVIYLLINNSNSHTNYNLNSFELSTKIIATESWKFRFLVLKNCIRIFHNFLKYILKSKKTKTLASLMFNDIYDEKFDNLDSELVAIKHMISNSRSKVIYVRGSFQNFTYFDRISHQKIGLKNPSIHYRQILSIMDKVQPLLIHIRLGDYLGTNLGILSQQYYYEAFIELEKKFVHNEIWVVSNQIDLAKTMTNSFSDKRFSFEINYFIKNPCELLLLMSNSKSLIISNSTFSLWAAKFAKPDCKVAYPKEFFKGRNFLSNNFNKSWIPINSHWQF